MLLIVGTETGGKLKGVDNKNIISVPSGDLLTVWKCRKSFSSLHRTGNCYNEVKFFCIFYFFLGGKLWIVNNSMIYERVKCWALNSILVLGCFRDILFMGIKRF